LWRICAVCGEINDAIGSTVGTRWLLYSSGSLCLEHLILAFRSPDVQLQRTSGAQVPEVERSHASLTYPHGILCRPTLRVGCIGGLLRIATSVMLCHSSSHLAHAARLSRNRGPECKAVSAGEPESVWPTPRVLLVTRIQRQSRCKIYIRPSIVRPQIYCEQLVERQARQ
jgi:hypothetical protein